MATILLSNVGTAIGGPAGGAIGALIGQQIDNRILFAPKPTHGPRVKELAVQTSQYGTPIPAVFGRMRVAGTVIWATDLIESKTKSGGKGAPKTVNYSYRVSFAVALSCRVATRLGRIWADGKLLREDGGALSSGGTLRFYTGDAAQMPDPLIAADVGADQCPAFRGLAYAVVEDMPLAEFGNRIPSLTFEVIADEGPNASQVSLDTIALYASDGRLTAPNSAPLIGYAAEGADLDAWLAPLIAVEGRVMTAAEHGFALLHPTAPPVTLPADRVSQLNAARQEERGLTLPTAAAPPPPITLRYYDAARDYQIAVQTSIGGDQNQPAQSIDLPAVMSAATASALVHRVAYDRRTGAPVEERIVPEDWAEPLPIGALYRVEDTAQIWQVIEREWLNGAVRLTARRFSTMPPLPSTGSSGSHIGSSVAAIGATHMLAIELPAIPGLSTTTFLTAAGEGAGWRGAMAYAEEDGIARPLGWLQKGAVMGHSVAALSAHNGLLSDPMGVLEIDLLHADMELPPANAAAQPLLWMNGEILSYADAVPETATRWRLSGLTRALYNSAVAFAHPAGSTSVLLDAAMPHWPLSLTTAPVGGTLDYSAEGAEDDPPATASLTVRHLALRPPAPVHGRWWRDGANLHLSWTRRSRSLTPWQDYLDTPLGETAERYRIDAGAAFWEASEPTLTLPIAALPEPVGGALTLSIRHIGDTGASVPLVLTIPEIAVS